jgi:S1-C subfamily serine protease
MKQILVVVLLLLLAGCSQVTREERMVNMTLKPSVAITVGNDDGFGSGTVIKVTREGAYILTNDHVVKDGKDIVVRFYNLQGGEFIAEVFSRDADKDIAVLFAPHMCSVTATLGRPEDVSLFKESICVGSSSKYPLAPSKGIITQMDFIRGDQLMYRSDCNITFGNSGGGLYVETNGVWKLVGIPTAVHAHSIFGNRAPVSFLGFMVRIEDILEHLEAHQLL